MAKYLRIMGLEVHYPPSLPDVHLIGLTLRNGAILLTRDREICEKMRAHQRGDRVILLRSDDIQQQVTQVLAELKLDPLPLSSSSRCIYCGGELGRLDPTEARNLVPPFVYLSQLEEYFCGNCNLVYWKGTHWSDFERRLSRILRENHYRD